MTRPASVITTTERIMCTRPDGAGCRSGTKISPNTTSTCPSGPSSWPSTTSSAPPCASKAPTPAIALWSAVQVYGDAWKTDPDSPRSPQPQNTNNAALNRPPPLSPEAYQWAEQHAAAHRARTEQHRTQPTSGRELLTVNARTRPTVHAGRQAPGRSNPDTTRKLSFPSAERRVEKDDRREGSQTGKQRERRLNVNARTQQLWCEEFARGGAIGERRRGGLVMGFDRALNGSRSRSTTQGYRTDPFPASQRRDARDDLREFALSKLGTFVWGIADQLRGVYKPHQYGGVILPFTILRRLDCVLAPTREEVRALAASTATVPWMCRSSARPGWASTTPRRSTSPSCWRTPRGLRQPHGLRHRVLGQHRRLQAVQVREQSWPPWMKEPSARSHQSFAEGRSAPRHSAQRRDG